MIVKLQIPDDVFETYERMAEDAHRGSGKALQVNDLMATQLDRFRLVSATDRILVVDSRTRAKLENILGGGSLKDSSDLLAKVDKLGSIRIGGIRLEFTPSQLQELKNVANRNRKKVEQVVEETVKRMEAQFFDRVGM